MTDPNNQEQQAMMAEVLRGGRGRQKRLHAVDESLYGTEEGAKLQQRAIEKTKKKGKKKKKNQTADLETNTDAEQTHRQKLIKQSVAAVAVTGILPAGASVFLGGKRQYY